MRTGPGGFAVPEHLTVGGLDMRLGTAARSPVLQTAHGVAELWNAIEKLGWLLRSTVETRSLLESES